MWLVPGLLFYAILDFWKIMLRLLSAIFFCRSLIESTLLSSISTNFDSFFLEFLNSSS